MHSYFAEKLGTGQKALFAVLKCVAVHVPATSYVQGMNTLCGTLMTYTSPEDAFAMMVSFLEHYDLKEMFLPGLPGLEKNFYLMIALQRKYMPKLFNHLRQIYFMPQMYASRWFMTLFSDYFPIEVVVRILDIYVVEGRKILFRIALAIFKLLERDLMGAEDCERPIFLIKNLPQAVDLDRLLQTAHSFRFSGTLLE